MILTSYMLQREQGIDAAIVRKIGREPAPDAERASEAKLLLSVLLAVARGANSCA